MNYKNFSYEIYQLKQAQKFNEILELLDNNKQKFFNEIKQDKFVISNILTSLRKTNNSNLADRFIDEFQINFDEELVLNAYGWCLFENIKNKNINLFKIEKTLNLLFQTNSNYSYNVITNILRIGIKNIENPSFLDFFNKEKLSLTPQIFNSKEYASDKEKWYSQKTKQLINMKNYQECYELSKEALESINKFHNFNEIWFTRRMALSLGKLGNLDEAISSLEKIYKKKREWYILGEIAELYLQKGDKEKSFELAISAINSRVPLEFKLGVISLLSKLVDEKMALKHLLLIKKIKQEKGYKIQNEILEKVGDFDMDFKVLKKELGKFWRDNLPKDIFKTGVITKILHDNERGIVGFIKSDKDYYFSTKLKVKIDDKVEFELINEKAKITKILR